MSPRYAFDPDQEQRRLALERKIQACRSRLDRLLRVQRETLTSIEELQHRIRDAERELLDIGQGS